MKGLADSRGKRLLRLVAHLLDNQSKLWALDDSDGYPTKDMAV